MRSGVLTVAHKGRRAEITKGLGVSANGSTVRAGSCPNEKQLSGIKPLEFVAVC
jgi:hypothetical protein